MEEKKPTKEDTARVKGLGCLRDKRYDDVFNVRVITGYGKLDAAKMRALSDAAERFGTAAKGFDAVTASGIQALADSKYSTDEWNIGRMADFGLTRKKRFDFGSVGLGLDVRDGRVARIRLDGDYFGVRDISELEGSLIGAFCTREEIERRLIAAGVGGYIAGADAAALAEFICP